MEKDIRILMLEDNYADADLIIRQLKKSGMAFSIEVVETRQAYEAAMEKFNPDIILSDYSMPSFDAKSAFTILQSKGSTIPFLIVSGTVGEENVVMLIKEGVTDFASKNNLVALPQKIIRAMKEVAELHEKKNIIEQLKIRTATLVQANQKLILQSDEKERRAVELMNANKELLAFNFISSHDLQEPLRKIQTFISILLDDEKENLSSTGKINLDRIQAATKRMRRLIDDLLAFSRVSNSDRHFEFADMHAILNDVTSELKDNIYEKRATIEASGLLPATVVVFQFRQLIYNLISNALKFSASNTPSRIIVETRIVKLANVKVRKLNSLLQKCDYWNISFTDNGIGFEPRFNERIFELFQRLHKKEDYPGTGIGLAIVRKIVNNHDGVITATGELNQGATFNIYLPIAAQH